MNFHNPIQSQSVHALAQYDLSIDLSLTFRLHLIYGGRREIGEKFCIFHVRSTFLYFTLIFFFFIFSFAKSNTSIMLEMSIKSVCVNEKSHILSKNKKVIKTHLHNDKVLDQTCQYRAIKRREMNKKKREKVQRKFSCYLYILKLIRCLYI